MGFSEHTDTILNWTELNCSDVRGTSPKHPVPTCTRQPRFPPPVVAPSHTHAHEDEDEYSLTSVLLAWYHPLKTLPPLLSPENKKVIHSPCPPALHRQRSLWLLTKSHPCRLGQSCLDGEVSPSVGLAHLDSCRGSSCLAACLKNTGM